MPPSIEEIIITPELLARQAHPSDVAAETAAMRRLGETMETDPSKTFQVCVDLALELCHADSCGISLLDRTDEGEDVFRWIALAGELREHLYGTTPRFFSPCGICVDNGMPLLMRRPEVVYSYLDVGPPFHDVLLIPLTETGSKLEGTIWIIAHNPERKFDLEDARVMQRVAAFTTTTLHLANLAHNDKATEEKQKLPVPLQDRLKGTLAAATDAVGAQPAFRVEIRLNEGEHGALTTRMSSMRQWLDHRRFEPAAFRYSSASGGFVLRVEFIVEAEARAFAEEFAGQVVDPATRGK